MDNPATRLAFSILALGAFLSIVFFLLPPASAYPFPEQVALSLTYVLSSIWLLDFIIDVPAILFFFNVSLHLMLISLVLIVLRFTIRTITKLAI